MEKDAVFQVWSTDDGPPSHSLPPHQAAKVAESVGPDAFEKVHDRLLRAYFTENRNITDENVIKELWAELALPMEALSKLNDAHILKTIVEEHNAAVRIGVTGVPAIYVEERPQAFVGLQEEAVYVRLVEKALENQAHPS